MELNKPDNTNATSPTGRGADTVGDRFFEALFASALGVVAIGSADLVVTARTRDARVCHNALSRAPR